MDDDFDFAAGSEAAPAEAEEEQFQVQEQTPSPRAQAAETSMPRRASSDAPMPIPPPSDATNKWKSDNEKKIKQRDAEFAKTKQDMLKKAEQSLEKIRSERAQLIAKNAKANREAQAKAQAAASAKSTPGAPVAWQRLAQLVDLEKEAAEKERMRSLLKTKVAESKA